MFFVDILEFSQNIRKYLNKVTENHETLVINYGKGSGTVIMCRNDYNSLLSTMHEMSSKKNQACLDAAIKKLETAGSFKNTHKNKKTP